MPISNKVTINKPIQHVWGYINDPEKLAEWLDTLEKYERTSGDPNNPKPGDTGKHYYNENGREIVMDEELLEYHPPTHVKIKLMHDWFDLEIVNNLREVDENTTELEAIVEMNKKSLLMKIMTLFQSKASEEKRHKEQLDNMKNLIEGS